MVTGGEGGTLSKCSKTVYYKNLLETYFVKPVGKYQFAMECIRASVMSAYKVINCLIFSAETYVLGTQKNRLIETVLLSTKLKVKSDM